MDKLTRGRKELGTRTCRSNMQAGEKQKVGARRGYFTDSASARALINRALGLHINEQRGKGTRAFVTRGCVNNKLGRPCTPWGGAGQGTSRGSKLLAVLHMLPRLVSRCVPATWPALRSLLDRRARAALGDHSTEWRGGCGEIFLLCCASGHPRIGMADADRRVAGSRVTFARESGHGRARGPPVIGAALELGAG